MGRIINTLFLIVDILWLLAFIAFIVVIGFFALEADNASIQNIEVNDIPLGPALVIEETITTEQNINGAYSAYGNLSSVNDTQVCKEDPKCTLIKN